MFTKFQFSKPPNTMLIVIGCMLNDAELKSLDKCLGSKCKLPRIEYSVSGDKPQGYCALSIKNREMFKERVNKFRNDYPKLKVTVIDVDTTKNKLQILVNIATIISAIGAAIFTIQWAYDNIISLYL